MYGNRMVLAIILPFHDLPTRKMYRFYNVDLRVFMMATYPLLPSFYILCLGTTLQRVPFLPYLYAQ